MAELDQSHPLVPRDPSYEDDVETTALLSTLIPIFGGFISNILNGVVAGRRRQRVLESLSEIVIWLENVDFRVSDSAKEYIRTEDFEELLTETLERVSREHNEERRRLYGLFLVGSITSPEEPYDDQLRFLKTIDELQRAHLIVLRAYAEEPDPNPGRTGTITQTLTKRIGNQINLDGSMLSEFVVHLHRLDLISDGTIGGTMTGVGAEQLDSRITGYGKRFMAFLADAT